METCGDCAFWDTAGYGVRKDAIQGKCTLVAQHNSYQIDGPIIALTNTEHSKAPGLIAVITRRHFGCNQHAPRKRKFTMLVIYKNKR